MDIVLEVFDTFGFDYMYSKLLPASTPSAFAQAAKHAASSTFSSLKEGATMHPTDPSWSFDPASKLLSFEPSQWAYRSQWPRDNIYRQALSLYLITWYVYHIGLMSNACLTMRQAFRPRHLFRLRFALLSIHLRQEHIQAPEIPQEPGSP